MNAGLLFLLQERKKTSHEKKYFQIILHTQTYPTGLHRSLTGIHLQNDLFKRLNSDLIEKFDPELFLKFNGRLRFILFSQNPYTGPGINLYSQKFP